MNQEHINMLMENGERIRRENLVAAMSLSNRTAFHDETIMPFGKHKGKKLGEIEDSYFRWFLSQDWCDEWPELVKYANHVLDE